MSSKRGGIDYSKWDKMDFSDDSDEEGQHLGGNDNSGMTRQATNRPRVTRLDQPSRVTAKDGVLTVEQQQPSTTPTSTSMCTVSTKVASSSSALAESPASSLHVPTIPSKWTDKGGAVAFPKDSESTLYWSQDRYEVVLRTKLPSEVLTKSVRIAIDGKVHRYDDRHCATLDKVGIRVTATRPTGAAKDDNNNNKQLSNELVLLEGTLSYPIHYPQDHDADTDTLDWTIESVSSSLSSSSSLSPVPGSLSDTTQRFFCLTLLKASPMHEVTLWWKKTFEEIDETVESPSAGKANDWKGAWDEAHKLFQEKIAKGRIQRPLE